MWSEKLHYKFIESTEDGDFMLALNAVKAVKDNISSDCSIHINKQNLRDYNNEQVFSNIQDH